MVAFHEVSNTLDVTLRPMTILELSTNFHGCDWLENRIHAVRGSRCSYGPVEIHVNGGQDLDTDDDPVSGAVKRDVPRMPVTRVANHRTPGSNPDDSGVSIGRRVTPEQADGGNSAGDAKRRNKRPSRDLAAGVAAILSTPTRPVRTIPNARDCRAPSSVRSLVRSESTAGGRLFVFMVH